MSDTFEELTGNAIPGIDTLWGGDVRCASGTGRFIADSWFSDRALPRAYTAETAARVRQSGGVSAATPEKLLPVLFGARGLVDITTIDRLL